MQNILNQIVEDKKLEVAAKKAAQPLASINSEVQPAKGTFLPSISKPGIRVIAEIKPKSPSSGRFGDHVNVSELAEIYSKQAAAISVLTDAKYFGGSIAALAQVSKNSSVPTLCKDFIIDEYQVSEARVAGAEAVLLIVKILTAKQLKLLHQSIQKLGMVPVVEIQNEAELARALAIKPQVLLINNRDLSSFEIDLQTTERLIPLIPKSIKVISASGLENNDDILRLSSRTNIFLIGSSLMRAEDVESKLRSLCNPFLVKTCGITNAVDASATISLGSDLIGIIFAANSPRKISPDQAKNVCQAVGSEKVVAVFQNQSADEILTLREQVGFKYVQLHGDESPDMVRALKPCIKAISLWNPEDIERANSYKEVADFIIFDRPKADNPLKWIELAIKLLNDEQPLSKFLMAGGLAPGNVRATINAIKSPNLVGVDVASGTESMPGVKDLRLVHKFITEARGNAVAG